MIAPIVEAIYDKCKHKRQKRLISNYIINKPGVIFSILYNADVRYVDITGTDWAGRQLVARVHIQSENVSPQEKRLLEIAKLKLQRIDAENIAMVNTSSQNRIVGSRRAGARFFNRSKSSVLRLIRLTSGVDGLGMK
jgi:hypothetical protein